MAKQLTEEKQQIKSNKREKKGVNMNMYGFTKFINIVLLVATVYFYIQLTVTQTEFRMYKQYNPSKVGTETATSKPNLPPILELR
jgi:hypothetical protein